ncbi:unnamed protein product [Prorocentrum cordatum]|uniref:Uncharacterized protein n=1 Tax=Prorocentrum cordatum TaxID=2364126 RepID=A0ABN9V0G1_9DINO|nr:unnamed protein product [Polarella glacialis]
MKAGVRPDNRDEAGLAPLDVPDLLGILVVKGWGDDETSKALACDDDTSTRNFNVKLAVGSDGLLPLVEDPSELQIATVRCSHTTATLLCIHGEVRSMNQEMSDEHGRVSMARICERQPSLKQPLERDLKYNAINALLVARCPELMKLMAQSGDADHGAARQATTVQRAKKVWMIAKMQPGLETAEDWARATTATAHGEHARHLGTNAQDGRHEWDMGAKRTIACDGLQALSQLQFAEGPLWILALIEAQLASPPKWATPGGESTHLNTAGYKSMSPGGKSRSKAMSAGELQVRNAPLPRLDIETGVGDDAASANPAPKRAKLAASSTANGFAVGATVVSIALKKEAGAARYLITAITGQTAHVRGPSDDDITLKMSEVLDGYTVLVSTELKVVDCAQLDKFRRANEGAAIETTKARLRTALGAVEDLKIFGGGKLARKQQANGKVNLIATGAFKVGELQIAQSHDRVSIDKQSSATMRVSHSGGFAGAVVAPSVLELGGVPFAATLRGKRGRLGDEKMFTSSPFWCVQMVHEGGRNVEIRSLETSVLDTKVILTMWVNVTDAEEGQLILGPLQDMGGCAGGAVGNGSDAANRGKDGRGSRGGCAGGKGGKAPGRGKGRGA